VHAGAAESFTRQKRPELAHRQGALGLAVAKCQRVARRVLHQRVAHRVFQLVANQRNREVRVGRAHAAALERDHVHARLAQFLRENAAGPSEADDDDVNFFQACGHDG
jgi:hypothetical protein